MKLSILCSLLALLILSAQARYVEDNLLSHLLGGVHENYVNHASNDLFSGGIPTAEPTAEPSAEPSAEPTYAPTTSPTPVPGAPTLAPVPIASDSPTVNPSAAPTADPTINPSVAPTASPTVEPTAMPSAVPGAPTVAPTPVATRPTTKPTASPSAQVTLRPSATPTVHAPTPPPGSPTEAPTQRPSTLAPTRMTSPILSFSQNFTVGGSLSADLDANAQATLLNVTAWSMGVTVNTVKYKGCTATAENRRMLRSSGMSLFTTSWTILALTELSIPLDSTSYTDPTQLYNALVTALVNAVNSGDFTTQMQLIALIKQADSLGIAYVSNVAPGPQVDNELQYSGGNDDGLSGGAIAGIVIGVVVGVALIAAALYYFCFVRAGASKHEAFQSNSDVEISL